MFESEFFFFSLNAIARFVIFLLVLFSLFLPRFWICSIFPFRWGLDRREGNGSECLGGGKNVFSIYHEVYENSEQVKWLFVYEVNKTAASSRERVGENERYGYCQLQRQRNINFKTNMFIKKHFQQFKFSEKVNGTFNVKVLSNWIEANQEK